MIIIINLILVKITSFFLLDRRLKANMTLLTGWRYVVFVGAIVGGTAAALYPIVMQPMIDPGYYSKFLCNRNSISVK